MIRVVIDTNVVISAMINPNGFPSAVLHTVITSKHIMWYVSDPIFSEYKAVVWRPKFTFPKKMKSDFIQLLKKHTKKITPKENITILDDQADNRFLECASAAEAHFLITGNRKDFSLDYYKTTRIVSPRDFVEVLLTS